MKNMTLVAVVVLVLIALGGGAFFYTQRSSQTTDKMMVENPSDSMMGEAAGGSEGTMLNENSRYVAYSDGILEKAAGTRRVLFFYANWCPTCRPADAEFNANEGEIPSDVTLIRVNYNDDDTDAAEKALASQYGVTYQHTFVQIDENGATLTKWNGGSLSELLSNIQ